MADCDDRQLTQAQREAAYSQQARAGVVRAIRPFSGNPTIPNIIDYLNRELVPAVKTQRAKLNDIYRPVVDNAPSGNPLSYYFSENTANGDPTTGFIRFDNATQELATTIRVSETNGRLANAAPWLDVMAGGATTPLGTVTVSDLGDPTRFIRFDLNTMTDQGAYWDLGVTPIESSHDNPFVDGGPVTIGFIPGVASTPVTVPVGSVTPMGAHTVLGNPTNATAAPTEIGMPVGMSVLARKTTTGDIIELRADEFVPAFFPTPANLVLCASTGGTSLLFKRINTTSIVDVPSGHILINATNALGPLTNRSLTTVAGLGLSAILDPNYNLNVNASTSILVDFPGTNEVQRAALTGDVTAAQNSNTTAFRSFSALSVLARASGTSGVPTELAATPSSEAVLHEALGSIAWGQVTTGGYADGSITDAKITNRQALSLWGRAPNSVGAPADISTTSGSATVMRESGGTIGWGTIATAGLADDSVTNAKLANMAARTIKGRADSAGTGDPQDLTGAQAGEIVRFATKVDDSTSSGSVATYAIAEATCNIRFTGSAAITIHGATVPVAGEGKEVYWFVTSGAAAVVTFKDESATAGGVTERFRTPRGADVVLTSKLGMKTRYIQGRHTVVAGPGLVGDADYGDITVSGGGVTWTIDNDVVTDAKLRNSGALSVIGRSANSSGDPADISATAASGAVLRESGSTIGWGTVATAGIADGAVTLAKLANLAAGTVIGRQVDAVTGVPVALTGAEVVELLRFGTVQTASGALPLAITLNDDTTFLNISTTGDGDIQSVTGSTLGRVVLVAFQNTGTKTIKHAAGGTSQQFINPGLVDFQCTVRDSFLLVGLGTVGWQVVSAPLGINRVGNTQLADMAERRIKGRADSAGTGDPQDLTGAQVGAIWRLGNQVPDSTTTGSVATLTVAASTNQITFNSVSPVIHGINVPAEIGQFLIIQHIGSGSTSFVHESSTAGAAAQRLRLGPYGANTTALVISQNQSALFTYDNRWVWLGSASSAYDGDHGDITVTGGGVTWTIDNNTISDAKLRDSAALSVIGRSANSTGDPADIATSADGDVLRRSGTTLGFGAIATAGITDDAVTNAKLRNSGALSVIGRSTNSAGDPGDISATVDDRVLVRRSSALTFDQIVGNDIANGVITVAKLAGIGANTVIGNDTAGTLTPNAISVGTNTVLGRQGSNIVAAQVATGQIADAAVTLAKQADLAQSRIIGRAEGAGTGVPTALTPTQVVAIIDGESPTWTGSHTFSGTTFTVDVTGVANIESALDMTLVSGQDLTLAATNGVTVGSPLFVNNTAEFTSAITEAGIISVTITASQDDWAPSGFANARIIRVTASGGSWVINSIAAPTSGRLITIINVSSNEVVIANEGTGTAANRIVHNLDAPNLAQNETMTLWYDTTTQRWRVVAMVGSVNP